MNKEWLNEPNEKTFYHKGLLCKVVRVEPMKHLCGYVAVTEGHPLYLVDYDDFMSDIEVHGGVTFSAKGFNVLETHNNDDEELWWIGFDTAHYMDLSPRMYEQGLSFGHETYKNMDFVTKETKNLAEQITKIEGDDS